MLRLSNIVKRYNKQVVADSIDLEFEAGKTYALIGPSGCGKSTLLRIMIGLIQADEGSVFLDEIRLGNRDFHTARIDFGYVIQSGGLFPHLTARENVTLPTSYRKWDELESSRSVLELCNLTQLPIDALERYPAQLSGGQRQRVSLIRALILNPKILLLDEPLAALDPMIRSQLQVDLRHIFQSLGKTVVIVTHDLHEAAYFADQSVVMREGKIVQQGSIAELINRPANDFVKEFIAAQQNHLINADGGD